jgi:two-component system, NtrC family, response regulator HydG
MAKILVVDDEPALLALLQDALGDWGYHVKHASTGAAAIGMLRSELFDAALIDIRMPDMTGLDLLREIKRQDSCAEVVMMTGYPAISSAIEALREGAYDYLSKPLILDELRHLMARLVERRFLRGEVSLLRVRLGEELTLHELVGDSPPMRRLKDIIAKVASTDAPVLIEGESGTGKELVAAAIHRLSTRARGPLIPVNCSAIPADLIESEFFGHVRGAFTGAVSDSSGLFRSANEGSLFLDEIAELPTALQAKLLRVLQDMEVRPVGSSKAIPVDVRVIAATNRNLEQAMAQGALRQDLYYRLDVVRLSLPPLRERREDVPALVHHFIRRFNAKLRRTVRGISPEALAALVAHDFPGNVRELENIVERAFAMGARDQITLADLPTLGRGPVVAMTDESSVPKLERVERELILKALAMFNDDKAAAAQALGISRRTIYRRLREYGVD